MTYISYFILLMATVTLFEETKTYSVRKIQGDELHVTGKGDSPQWKKAAELSDFIYPWENKKATSMTFKALHSKDWFYCLYTVLDADVKVFVKNNDKLEVVKSERVEIFFRKDDRLSPYYGLELDPLARVLDYEAEYPRKFNSTWSWPKGKLIVKTNRTKQGYTVEVAIHKTSLEELGLLNNQKIEAGIFRAECDDVNGDEEKIKWISWLKPDSETPDFHIPSSFGVLRLED
jgi:Carbohydrate family 9 binding domain-like